MHVKRNRFLDVRDRFQFNGNRWYDTTTRRFLSEDPLGLAAGTNLTEYCGDSPTNFVDPYGLQTAYGGPAPTQQPGIYVPSSPLWELAPDYDPMRGMPKDVSPSLIAFPSTAPKITHLPPDDPWSWKPFLEGPGTIIGAQPLAKLSDGSGAPSLYRPL